jgi:hypothetical protein
MMHDREKSDPAIVAGKSTNKARQPAAESAEPRAGAEGNASRHRVSIACSCQRICDAASTQCALYPIAVKVAAGRGAEIKRSPLHRSTNARKDDVPFGSTRILR